MRTLLCPHCARPVFLRPGQLPAVAGLCVPCGDAEARQQRATREWRRLRDRLLGRPPAEVLAPRKPLAPTLDLRHL